MQLREENPKASLKELQKLFISAPGGMKICSAKRPEWFFDRNYPAELDAAKKH